MKFTKIPTNTHQQIQVNAGILASSFIPSTGTISASDIIGATSGGCNFTAVPSFKDWGEDIDNCPKNTKELKKLDDWEIKLSGTFVTTTTALAKGLLAAADIDSTDTTKVVPRMELKAADFDDLWLVGDYSDKNSESAGGFIAIHMIDALSTAGFSIQTTDKEKGKFAFEYTAHFSISSMNTVPCEIYIEAGT